jgi:hypothetical protein
MPVLPHGKPMTLCLTRKLLNKLVAAGVVVPAVLLARVEHERHGGSKREGRILADVEHMPV